MKNKTTPRTNVSLENYASLHEKRNLKENLLSLKNLMNVFLRFFNFS